MKSSIPKFAGLIASISTVLLSGCATQPSSNARQAVDVAPNIQVTGSRLAVKNTTEMIGIKTIDQANIRESKMWNNTVKDGL
jgi:hypothetical protein